METTAERKQFLFDVFVTALEGGIGYWSCAEEYHWTNDQGKTNDLEGFHAILVDTEAEEGEEGDFPRTLLDTAIVDKGVNLIINDPKVNINDSLRKAIKIANVSNDSCTLDAESTDCIIQAGMFGEIVFG